MQAAVEKIPAVENETEESITFTQEELTHFVEEINRQFASGNGISLGKALRNARYLAKLDRGFADIKSVKGTAMTFDELESFINEERSF